MAIDPIILGESLGRELDEYDEEELKTCTECGEQKPINQIRPYMDGFSKRNSGSKDGYRAKCKSCYNRLRYASTPDGRAETEHAEYKAAQSSDPTLSIENKSGTNHYKEYDTSRYCRGWRKVRDFYEKREREYRKIGMSAPMPEVGCGGKPLKLSEFHKNKSDKFGVCTICKWCKAEIDFIASLEVMHLMESSPMTPDDLPLPIYQDLNPKIKPSKPVEIND